jgi:hypothetical protein
VKLLHWSFEERFVGHVWAVNFANVLTEGSPQAEAGASRRCVAEFCIREWRIMETRAADDAVAAD